MPRETPLFLLWLVPWRVALILIGALAIRAAGAEAGFSGAT